MMVARGLTYINRLFVEVPPGDVTMSADVVMTLWTGAVYHPKISHQDWDVITFPHDRFPWPPPNDQSLSPNTASS